MQIVSHTLYLAPVPLYTQLYNGTGLIIDGCTPFVKQTYRSRATIATGNGTQDLNIPIVHDGGRVAMCDVRISEHGNWRKQHWNALVSAYRNSPFFEYYADDFAHFYEEKDGFLMDFNLRLHNVVCELMGLEKEITTDCTQFSSSNITDIRHIAEPKAVTDITGYASQKYYQVFAQRNGFIPNLSIIDLLFNMGPEALIVLRDSIID